MVRWTVLIGVALGLAGTAGQAKPPRDTLVLVGTQATGPGQGIVAARLDPTSGALTAVGLAAELKRPTWLERDPARPVVWAVSDGGNSDGPATGRVHGFAIDRAKGTLTPLNDVASGGRGPTHLAFDPKLGTLFVAHFGSGQVSAIPVGADGRLGAVSATQQHVGTGPHRRQAGPHAHAVAIDPSRRYVLSPDLGADRVFIHRYDSKPRTLAPGPTPYVALAPGSGPRHLVFARDGRHAYLVTELNAEVVSFRWNPRAGTLIEQARLSLAAPPEGTPRSASEIALSRDGRRLYVGNRGTDAIEVFAVEPGTGGLRFTQSVPSGGKAPWHFATDPSGRWLLVANQGSDTLNVLRIDRTTGGLSPTGQALAVPKPVVVAFD